MRPSKITSRWTLNLYSSLLASNDVFVENARKFEADSNRVADGFASLIQDLGDFKIQFSAWIKALKGRVTDKIASLNAEIENIKCRISSFRNQVSPTSFTSVVVSFFIVAMQIKAATLIEGIFGAAATLGLVPTFTSG
jgi:hypothetical protein